MIEFTNKMEAQEVNIMELAKAIKKACMRFPTYGDRCNCECFDTFEGKCDLGDPSGWPIDEGRVE